MKHMKLVFLICTTVVIYIIYTYAKPDTITYIALGDSFALGENPYGEIAYGYSDFLSNHLASKDKLKLYTKKFASKDARIRDLYQDINLNKKVIVNNQTMGLKNALREADVITVSIGANDLINKLNVTSKATISDVEKHNIAHEIASETHKLIKEMKKYNKKIVLVGYYNFYPNIKEHKKVFEKINDFYNDISKQESIVYIDLMSDFEVKKYLPNPFNIHPNILGYESIYKRIEKSLY